MTTALKTKRVEARISPADDAVLRAAASHSHLSLSEFMIQAALIRAQTLIADRQAVELEADSWLAFVEALDAEPSVNEGLANAITRARADANDAAS